MDSIYELSIERIKKYHIKKINNIGPLFLVSTTYKGVWLEHVYDSIMYAKLFNATSVMLNTINAFIDLQLENGLYPYSIKEDNTVGYYQIQECVSFGKMCMMAYEMVNDNKLLLKMYESLKKWVSFMYKYRMTLGLNLVEMFVGYDTGHDNSGRLDGMKYKQNYTHLGKKMYADILPDCDTAPIVAVDMNCNLFGNLKALAKMANILGLEDDIIKYNNMAYELKDNIFKYLYDENDCYFYDLDKNKNKRKYKSSTIFHLFLEGVLDKTLDKKLIDEIYNRYINNPNEFMSPYPFPAMSLSDKSIYSHKMNNSWGYYSQALIALRCSLWMDDYGYSSLYDEVLKKWCIGFVNNFNISPMSQELDPITGAASGASAWYSTSMLLFIYAKNRLGI